MGLWIRSQNKLALVQPTNLMIGERTNSETGKISSMIADFTHETFHTDLGEYETKERAIEVLNEIQTQLINIEHSNFMGMQEVTFTYPVYQMPEK